MRGTVPILLGLWLGLSAQASARTSTNSWQGATAKWETTKQWSLNKLPDNSQDIVIANPGTFTVTIDDLTASNFPGAMTISSLSMSNTAGLSTLLLTNRPASTIPITLTVSNNAVIGAGSILNLVDASSIGAGVTVQASNLTIDTIILLPTNVTVSVTNSLLLGSTASATGIISVIGGTLIANLSVGNGSLLLSNGVFEAASVNIGVVSNAHGVWQIAGGSNTVSGGVSIGVAAGATGEVVIASGELSPSGNISVGVQGVGCLVTSNGFIQTGELDLGLSSGGRGIWQIAGGTNGASTLSIGANNGATGDVVVTGGELDSGYLSLGSVGSLVISNGTINVTEAYLATLLNGAGTVTVAGGTLNIGGDFYLGYDGTGTVWLTGGEIDVSGLTRLVGEDSGGTYLSQLVCSGGVLRASEVDVGHPDGPTSSGSSLWTIAGGTSIVSRTVYVVSRPNQTGLLTISDGLLQTPLLELGTFSGGGSVVVSGGVLQVTSGLFVGDSSGLPSQMTVTGGSITANGISVGTAPGSVGVLTFAGGELDSTNRPVSIGIDGTGQMLVSSGTINALSIYLGQNADSTGTLTISGGVVSTPTAFGLTPLIVGGSDLTGFGSKGGTGSVWFTGGTLKADAITVGDTGFGSMSISSNAVFQSHIAGFGPIDLTVGNQTGGVGVVSMQGGTLLPSPTRRVASLQIGVGTGSTGTVWVTDGALEAGYDPGDLASVGGQGSGRLSATNSQLSLYCLSVGSQGTLECVNSVFEAPGPSCSAINSNMMLFVNSTGGFGVPIQNVGSIVADGSTLTFYDPVNNSGLIVLTNGTAQFAGGITNSGAVLFGPDKFLITSVSATGSDVAITWQGFTGNRYRVQAADSPTDTFSDVSSDIVASGSGLGTTNYVDSGAVTNAPARFYRIRQMY